MSVSDYQWGKLETGGQGDVCGEWWTEGRKVFQKEHGCCRGVPELAESHITVVTLALLLGCGRSPGAVVRRAVEMLEWGHGSSSLLLLL